MGKHLQNPPDNIYAQFGDKLQRKREIGIHDSQKNNIFLLGGGVNKHHCKMTVLGLRWVEATQREGGGGENRLPVIKPAQCDWDGKPYK